MNDKFDQLTRSMAQSVTRRGALKKFGLGLAGMALACFGLANKAQAADKCTKCINKCLANHPTWPTWLCNSHCLNTGDCKWI